MGRRSRGYVRIVGPNIARAIETDAVTCNHCNAIVETHDRITGKALSSVLVHCHGCDKHICVKCAEQPKCVPLEKKIEQIEASARLRAQIGVP